MITDSASRRAALLRPFSPDRIEWRIQSSGVKADGSIWAKVLCYITQRAAFERLDEVYGESWSMEETFHAIGNNAVCVCRIDIAGNDAMPARSVSGTCAVEFDKAGDIDPFKTAASGALKRSVVSLGIGRYLYDLDEAWAETKEKGGLYTATHKDKDGRKIRYTWNPPALPAWALPNGQATAPISQAAPAAPAEISDPGYEEPESAPVYLDTSKVKFNDNYTPPAAAPAAPAKERKPLEEDPVIPFGRSKGKKLSELDKADLDYWANKWEPRPWEKTGKVTARDNNLKRKAQELYAARSGGQAAAAPAEEHYPHLPSDEVPF